MGRTNYAILAMGLASMLVMSLLMKQFLHKADTKRTGPLVHELSATFGGRLDRESEVALERADKTSAALRASVKIYPMMGTTIRKLAQEVGEYVWRRIGDQKKLVGVTVICLSLTDKQPQEFEVPKPYMTGSPAPASAAEKPGLPGPTKKGVPATPNAPAPGRGTR